MENKKKTKKKKAKKTAWLIICSLAFLLALGLILLALNYKPAENTPQPKQKYVSKYISNQLAPYIYNNAQKEKPFDLIIEQRKTDEFINLAQWPRTSGLFVFSAPKAYFLKDQFIIQSTASSFNSIDTVITIKGNSGITPQGLLYIKIDSVYVGSINLTFLAGVIAKKIYQKELAKRYEKPDSIGAAIAAAILNDQPFDPVFTVTGQKIRITDLKIEKGLLKLTLDPLEQ